MQLRDEGQSYREIAEELGRSTMDVHLEREAAEDYAQSDLEPNSLGHFSLDFLTQSSDARDEAEC